MDDSFASDDMVREQGVSDMAEPEPVKAVPMTPIEEESEHEVQRLSTQKFVFTNDL